MCVYPLLDIRFPENKEATLIHEMKSRVERPWQWQHHDAFHRSPGDGRFYFHRDECGSDPPCTLCIWRKAPGHLVAHAIVPDTTAFEIGVQQFTSILGEFDRVISSPAAEALGGMTQLGTSKHRLEDYLSSESVRLLELFCNTSNATDLGTHASDQEKWMAFLIHVHRQEDELHCDNFGACLKAKGWWPDAGIPKLVQEFDFAMRLLQQAGASAE
jgi:hypothetical protein